MRIYVDRIENQVIVCTCNGFSFDLPLKILPDVKEGDVYTLSKSDDASAKDTTQKLIDKLFE